MPTKGLRPSGLPPEPRNDGVVSAAGECVSKNFKPGWLMRTGHAAHISCMVDHSPSFFARVRGLTQTKRPIPASEAQEVFALMDTRFKQWTGQSLAEYLRKNPEKSGGAER